LLTTTADALDTTCGDFTAVDFTAATQATCTTYKDSLFDADGTTPREPTPEEYESYEYMKACYGVEGATSVTAFGAAIVAAIAALAF
jgi:hypothetical protein